LPYTSLENLFRTDTVSSKEKIIQCKWCESWKERGKMTGNIQERESVCIMGEYISDNDSMSLCKLSPFFCRFIKIISEVNLLL